ncbi:MAG: OmpA family protein [Deltaproteobacteria bacterium]|nr:OmpA family protein [Deltaproteobacteria bacterium]
MHLRLLALALAFAGVALPPSPARAQGGSGFALERYEPTTAGEWCFAVDHPWYTRPLSFAVGLTLDYAHKPLVLGYRDDQGFHETAVVVRHLVVGHVDAALSFRDRVTVSLGLPVILDESGTASAGISPSGAALGDLRLGVMGRLYGRHLADRFAVSLGALLWAPTAAGSNHAGDEGVRVAPKLVLGGLLARQLLWSVTGAVQYRPKNSIGDLPAAAGNSVGTELQLGAALAYADFPRRFVVGPEVVVSSVVTGGHAFEREFTAVELLLGGHHRLRVPVQLGVAAGLGLQREPGSPDFRVVARVAWVPTERPAASPPPPPSDQDHDGIVDAEDACPNQPGPASKDPKKHGCPRPADRDQDGIPDAEDLCPDEHQGPTPDPTRRGCPARDRDKDGVFDHEDLCPDEPQGSTPDPQRRGCPDKDTDGDGVPDSKDQCPTTPAGPKPDPTRVGCPAPDRDGDSVPDHEDACPDQPGAPHPDPMKNGCPSLVEVKGSQLVIVKPVFFATARDVILKQSFPVLQAVADALKARPDIKRLSIEGHTDSRGKAAMNRDLSDRRARSVMRWLIQNGIAAERLTAKGFGPDRPIADNKTEKGRAQNRRVEFLIVDPPSAPQ